MPGVSKNDLKLSATENVVTISAKHEDKKYHTEVPLLVKIDAKSADASYNNGIRERGRQAAHKVFYLDRLLVWVAGW